jgi:hypothetical protein
MLGKWLLAGVIVAAVLFLPAGLRGDDTARPASEAADRDRIDRLIRQLGSDEFSQRDGASRQLEKIGPPAVEALRAAAASNKDAEVRRRAADIVAVIENTLEQLVIDYRALGLPLPPKDAKLVRYEAGGGGLVNGKVQPKWYGLAFLLKSGTKTESATLLRGPFRWQPIWDPHPSEVKPDPEAVEEFVAFDELSMAIQCQARGWQKLAQHFLERSRKDSPTAPRQKLIRMAWGYWETQLTAPKVDRAPVAKRLKELIGRDESLNTEGNRALLKSLDLALVPSKAKPGSVEALIDALVDFTGHPDGPENFQIDDCYWRVAGLGFDAVPALIEHLDDDRLTRDTMQGFNNFQSWKLRVGDVVSDLLEDLAGDDIDRDWLRRVQGYRLEKAKAKKWYDEARKVGEETYLVSHVLPPADREGDRAQVSVHHLRVLVAKYPKQVVVLYRTILEKRPKVDSYNLPPAILRCKLPVKEKLEVLLQAAKHKDRRHRLDALYAIKDLNMNEFNSQLIAALEQFPEDVPAWARYDEREEAVIARLAHESDDPRVWQTLEKVVKRSAVGLRMELLYAGLDYHDQRFQRRELLHHFVQFLDDSAVRDTVLNDKYGLYCAAHEYPRIEVRNFVALQLAQLLEIEVEFNPKRTPEDWAKIRAKVREAVDRELGKKK